MRRLPDRSVAIEENAAWIRDRNLSCGIFGKDAVRFRDIEAVKACLLKETTERTAILLDADFDCLATNTPAGAVICSDPSLAIAESELNGHVLRLISKLNDSDAGEAFAEYARWIRDRDRKCDLVGKDNVPLDELTSSEGCLTEFLRQKTAEMVAAKDDPKRIFGQRPASPLPNADAVDLCVARIHSTNACRDFLRVSRVFEIDSEVAENEALITAEVEMVVLSPFAACSPVAAGCTGACWDLQAGKPKPARDNTRDSFAVAHRIRIEKSFAFRKGDNGWRCDATALHPVDFGQALGTR